MGSISLGKAAKGLKVKTAVHICYGYGIKAIMIGKNIRSRVEAVWKSISITQSSKINQLVWSVWIQKLPLNCFFIGQKEVLAGVIDVGEQENWDTKTSIWINQKNYKVRQTKKIKLLH